MILADTSAWIEYDRATGSRVHRRLATLIRDGGEVAVTEPVVMEVLARARTDTRQRDLEQLLDGFDLLAFDVARDFTAAVTVYRRCRQGGVTPRGLMDCMIAGIAMRTGSSLLAHDADLAQIATVMPLDLDVASLRP